MTTRTPAWATKIVDASVEDDSSALITSTRQSANLFRIECARTWQQRLHQAQRKAWATTVKTMLEPKAQEHKATTTTASETTCPLEYYSLVPSVENDGESAVDDLLLPMTMVSPPPACRLDRQAMSEAIWDHYQYQYQDTRCCTLWLPRLLPTLHATLHLLVRQCVNIPTPLDQEFQNHALRYFRKQQKKRYASMKHLLLWWAARTMAFDSLVIILQDPGGFSERKVWNDFIATLQELREEQGLPVSLVVLGNVNCAGNRNLRLRHVKCCPTTWMKEFWQELVHMSQTPLPLSSMDQLLQLGKEYALEHQSLTKFGTDLMAHVTSFYCNLSHLVWDGLELHPSFLAWFHVHGTAKKWLSAKPGFVKCIALKKCQHFQQQLQWWWSWQVKLFPLVFTVNLYDRNNPRTCLEPLAELYSLLPKSLEGPKLPVDVSRYLDRMGKGDKNMEHVMEDTLTLSTEQLQAQTMLYELIILLGHAMSNNGEAKAGETESEPTADETMKGIHQMLYDMYEFVLTSMDGLVRAWDQSNPLSKPATKRSNQAHNTSSPSTCLHHRHELVEGLISPAKELYGLLQGRLSIPREEWLYQFGGSTLEFVRGVWTLVVLGLVQAKSKRVATVNTVYYEKVGVVWC